MYYTIRIKKKPHELIHFNNSHVIIVMSYLKLNLSQHMRFWYISHMRKVVLKHRWPGTLLELRS